MIGWSLYLSGILTFFVQCSFADTGHPKDTAQEDNPVLMSKDKTVVTRADFEAQLQEMPEEVRTGLRTSMERITKIVDSLYIQKRLAQEARDSKLDQDPLIRKRIELATDKLLSQVRLDAVVREAAEPDLEALAKEQYLANPDKAQLPEEVRVSHILIGTRKHSEEEAKQLAEKVRTEVLENKQSFAELAKKYSEDPSVGNNQGDLGFFTRGKMTKPFEDAAFALKTPGEISPVVKSDFGFHIIRFEARNPPRKMRFDEVKKGLIRTAKEQYIKQVQAAHLAKITSPEGVQVNSEAIKALHIELPKEMQSKSQQKQSEPAKQ